MTDSRPIIGAEGLPRGDSNTAQTISAVEKKGDAAIESLRRETLLEVRQITSLLTEWRAAHEAVHVQQKQALDAATAALTDKLSDMNEFRQQSRDREAQFASREAVDAGLAGLKESMDSEKSDTRRRFETMEAKLNEMVTTLSKEARTEGRPGQDLRNNTGAIVAAVFFLIAMIGVVVTLANFATAH